MRLTLFETDTTTLDVGFDEDLLNGLDDGEHNMSKKYCNIDNNVQILKYDDDVHDVDSIQKRSTEINSLLKSVEELNNMMMDLSTLVVSQRCTIDRVDYHIESSAIQIKGGMEHLIMAQSKIKTEKKGLIAGVVGLFLLLLILVGVALIK